MAHDHFWPALRQQAGRLQAALLTSGGLKTLIAAQPDLAVQRSLRVGGIYASFARHWLDAEAFACLQALAHDSGVSAAIRNLFDGARVNVSEQRPALHTALRSNLGESEVARAAHAQARTAREQMTALIDDLSASDITDVVNVGIGGSDLGPRLAVDALRDFNTGRFRVHFLNNADASAVQHLLPQLDPARTAVVLVSKSFGTRETLLNGRILGDWLAGRGRLYAVSANVAAAQAFGVEAARILPMWDWVGGRYSLWSAVGFSIALSIGMAGFERLLAGASAMDAHVRSAPIEANLSVWHALHLVWNRNALGLPTHVVLPYDQRLALLPDYLQQLVMESLGKSVCSDGQAVPVATVPILWGSTGTSAQHSFFQALHQGADIVPADFIGVVRPSHPYPESHAVQLANLLAQAEALANGHGHDDPQRRHPGGRPSTLFLIDALTPETLGSLLAMYEHSVYVLSVLWGINAFDQWGVERGKHLAEGLLPLLADRVLDDRVAPAAADPVTAALIAQIHARQSAAAD